MSRFWSPIVQTLTPYVPGEQPQMQRLVKLNTNESPYGPSPKALAAISNQNNDDLRLYPDPEGVALKKAIAKLHGLNPNQIFLGNGSDEVLAHVFAGLLKQSRPVYFPDITYSFYPVYCKLYSIAFDNIPLSDDFSISVDNYLKKNNGRNGGIIFPNPNAPTGKALPLKDIETLLQSNKDSVVVIDEAYVEFNRDENAIDGSQEIPGFWFRVAGHAFRSKRQTQKSRIKRLFYYFDFRLATLASAASVTFANSINRSSVSCVDIARIRSGPIRNRPFLIFSSWLVTSAILSLMNAPRH